MPQKNFQLGPLLYLVGITCRHVLCSLQFSSDCSNNTRWRTELNLPIVKVYDASDSVPNYDNNGTVVLKKPEGEEEERTLGWLGLECEHDKPIRWVYNLDFAESGLGDSYSQTGRRIDDFHNVSSYKYEASIETRIHTRKLNFILMCVAFDNPCERRVVEANYDSGKKLYVLTLLSKAEENHTLVKELETAIINTHNWGQTYNSDSKCTVNFSIEDGLNSYAYLFNPTGRADIKPRTVPARQTLQNAYLFHEHLNRHCIKDHCKINHSASCFNVTKLKESKYWPLVFFMTDGKNLSRVVHMYHTLVQTNTSEPGRLKFAWEYSNPQDFVTMVNLPSIIYLHQVITIRCRVSPFLFSAGTQIGYMSNTSTTTNKMTFIKDVVEDPEFEESFETTGNLTLSLNDKNSKITVYCFAPVWNSSEWVNISREIEPIEPTAKVHERDGQQFSLELNSYFSTSCTATGIPMPDLVFSLPGNTTRASFTESKDPMLNFIQINITINNIDESHSGHYNCVATNPDGTSFYTFEIKVLGLTVSEKRTTSTLTIALISVFGAISTIFVAIVIILLVRFRMEKEEFRRLTEEAIREFMDGLDTTQVPTGEADHLYANDGVKLQPYNPKYEVHHRHWNFSGTMLGSGAFGLVQKGDVEIGSRKSVVAIKTAKSVDEIDDFRAMLLELKIMSAIGHHRHVVRLIAASTDDIQNRKVFIGVEFCANGNLLSYLQKRKKLFTNLVKDGHIEFKVHDKQDNDVHGEGEEMYMNLVTSDISTIDLYKWSFQIASGMDFLESKKVLHADLAARNILLTEDLLVKVSDFGLSRELFENSEYMKKTQVVLPFKWMAPESLKWLKFSSKSDVWAFGVTCYELFTLGDEPYPGQTWNEEFIQSLDNGMRMDRPPFCTENVYTQIMMQCWQAEPSDRIRFVDAMAFFEKAIGCLTSSPRKSVDCREFC